MPGSRRHLVEESRLEINSNSFSNDKTDINGTRSLCPVEPLAIIGGTISESPRKSVVLDFQPLHSKESNTVIQETLRRRLETVPDAEKTKLLATKENLAVEEE